MALKWLKLPELDTRSVIHVVNENFEKLGQRTYVNRIIYIGEHTLKKDEFIRNIHIPIKAVNEGYVDVPLTGVLLVYDSYFVHIIEGSEDTINRQLRFMFRREKDWAVEMDQKEAEEAAAAAAAAEAAALAEGLTIIMPPPSDEPPVEKPERKMFRRMKMLIEYHSITNILFNTWCAVKGRPLSLVGTLDPCGPISEHMEQLRVCIDKLHKLSKIVRENIHVSFEGLQANDPKMEGLPEVALLDYLLESKYLHDLREVAAMHRRVDDYMFYFEMVWPLSNAFTPAYLYKLKIDDSFVEPLPVMPWEIKAKEEEEERKREEAGDYQQQSESDSD